jgi:hypothetical protein
MQVFLFFMKDFQLSQSRPAARSRPLRDKGIAASVYEKPARKQTSLQSSEHAHPVMFARFIAECLNLTFRHSVQRTLLDAMTGPGQGRLSHARI